MERRWCQEPSKGNRRKRATVKLCGRLLLSAGLALGMCVRALAARQVCIYPHDGNVVIKRLADYRAPSQSQPSYIALHQETLTTKRRVWPGTATRALHTQLRLEWR